MTAAKNLPEGFESTRPGLVFQNAANWSKVGETGRMVQGIYEGLTDEDAYGKTNHRFITTTSGVCYTKNGDDINEVGYEAGVALIINSTGGLDKKLSTIAVGTEVIVDFDGKITIAKGPMKGKSANQFSVYVKNK